MIAVAGDSSTNTYSVTTARQGTTCGNSSEALGDIVYVPGDPKGENTFVTSIRYLHVGSTPAGWIYHLNDGREIFQPASSVPEKDARLFGVSPPSEGNGAFSKVHGHPDLSDFKIDRCILSAFERHRMR